MNSLEKKMVEILKKLRENYGATAIKVNLEAEGMLLNEILKIKEISIRGGTNLTAKIGGCEALTDLKLAKTCGVNGIMAPMIESKFALEKYLEMCINKLLPEELKELDLLINLETIDGYKRVDEILSASNIDLLDGIVIGRSDLSSSCNIKNVNSRKILNITKDIFTKAKEKSIKCIVGGRITVKSIPFLKELDGLIDGFETKKVVFQDMNISEKDMEEAIILALKFEYYWYKLKQEYYGGIYEEDKSKINKISCLLS